MIEDNKQKIPCGGFYIGEGLELDDATKTLKSVGGGGGGATVVTFTLAIDGGAPVVTADMTPAQVLTAMETVPVVGMLVSEEEGLSMRVPFGTANPFFANDATVDVSVIFTSYHSVSNELRAFMTIVGDTETGWTFSF